MSHHGGQFIVSQHQRLRLFWDILIRISQDNLTKILDSTMAQNPSSSLRRKMVLLTKSLFKNNLVYIKNYQVLSMSIRFLNFCPNHGFLDVSQYITIIIKCFGCSNGPGYTCTTMAITIDNRVVDKVFREILPNLIFSIFRALHDTFETRVLKRPNQLVKRRCCNCYHL